MLFLTGIIKQITLARIIFFGFFAHSLIQGERRSLLPSVTNGSRFAASGGRVAWQGANRVSTDCGDGGGQLWAGTKYQKAETVRAVASANATDPMTERREGMATSCCPLMPSTLVGEDGFHFSVRARGRSARGGTFETSPSATVTDQIK
jgi:hypothetical protein